MKLFAQAASNVENAVTPFFEEAMEWQGLAAIRSGLAVTMPFVLLASLAVLLNSFPLESYHVFMEEHFGPDWRMFGAYIWNGTFGIVSLVMLFSIGLHLADDYNLTAGALAQTNSIIVGLVNISCLFCLIIPGDGLIQQRWLSVSGLFVSIVVGYGATNLFLFLYSCRRLRLYLPSDSVDTVIPQAFAALIPAMVTIVTFAYFSLWVQSVWHTTIHEALNSLLRMPFESTGDSLEKGLIYTFALHLLWFVGIHGANVLDPITHDIYQALMAVNQAAAAAGEPLPHIMTKAFLDIFVFMGGSGTSLSLALAMLCFGKSQSHRKLAGFSLLPGLFNINEVLLFGLPVILNPVLLIPFILTPLILVVVSYFMVSWGLVPGTGRLVEWTTPIFFNSYATTGSLSACFLQFFNLILGIFIYAPFVVLGDRLNRHKLGHAFQNLYAKACAILTGESQDRLVEGRDRAGALARSLLVDLEEAFYKGGQLFLEFQPLISATTGQVTAVEALCRWRHPVHGMVPAPITISLAEDSFLIREIGLSIFEDACAVRKQWLDAGLDDLVMNVNISSRQLERTFPREVSRILRKYELPPELLEFEVKESVSLDPASPQSQVLSRIQSMGLRVTIDDFGMGHSSLKYLKQFSVTSVKIGGSICRDVLTNPICVDIVSSITRLCRARGINSIAEYVENDAQVAVLRELGCDILQGYKIGKPLEADECLEYIQFINARSSVSLEKDYSPPTLRL